MSGPPIQGGLFCDPDLPDWKKERDEGMQRAEEHARTVWQLAADEMIVEFARTRLTFYAWEVTKALRAAKITTATDRAIGPRLVAAARLGLIQKSGHHDKNPLAHGCPSPAWRSLVYRGAP